MYEEEKEPRKCDNIFCPIIHFGYCTAIDWLVDMVCPLKKEKNEEE